MSFREEDGRPAEVLLVEDSPGDVRLTLEAFRDANKAVPLHVATDEVDAMAYLRREGAHGKARRPSLILTTSVAEADIAKSYQLQANCYLSKPVQLDEFEALVKSVNEFWLTKVTLPQPQPEGR